MLLAVGFLTFAFIAWDVVGSHWQKAAVESELEEQKQKAASLEAVIKEQQELENKIKAIDTRIDAIKKLRSEQNGPSAVLESIRERISSVAGLYLQSVEQKGEVLTITGNSPDADAVTQFGRSLEFSSGLFTNLNIETQRKEEQPAVFSPEGALVTAAVETVNFTIRCTYSPSKASASNNNLQANNSGSSNGNAPQQVANNDKPANPSAQTPPPPATDKKVQPN
jgi:Tfp pilus assembly protein PilN